MGRPGWAKLAVTVQPSTVVVPDVLGKHGAQMPLTQDVDARRAGQLRVSPRTEKLRPPALPDAAILIVVALAIVGTALVFAALVAAVRRRRA